MATLKETRENNRAIRAVAEWQKTIWYPVFFALLCVLSSSFGWQVYVPVFYVLAASVVFAALFCDDVKVLLTPVFLIFFAIGTDVSDMSIVQSRNDMLGTFELPGLINMIVAGGIMLIAIVARFVKEGVIKDIPTKRGVLCAGLVCLACAMLLNGVGSSSWKPINLAYGAFVAFGLMLMYFVVLGVSNRSEGVVAYVCKLCLVCGLTVCAEAWILFIRRMADGALLDVEGGGFNGSINRNVLVLGWGEANLIAGTLVTLVPPVMYLAYERRLSVLPYLAAVLMYVTVVVLNARTSMLMGGIILIVCIVLCCFGKNKAANRLTTLVLGVLTVLAGIIAFAVIGFDKLPDFLSNLLRVEQRDNNRFERWADGLRDFTRAPVFGVGFDDGSVAEAVKDANMYSNMYHDLFVELIGASGIVGLLAFAVHIKGVIELCLRKFRVERLIIMLGVVTVLLTSLLDNFFYYINIQLFYGALLAVSEIRLEETRAALLADHKRVPAGRKPRVVFTFVEAGMGHIIPEKAICDAFERKYGDKTEVVRSRFYAETGDENMKRFERGFVNTVKLQSRSRIFGKLCIFGNKLAGDALSQQFVMRMRYPDSKADGKAMRHLRELDADVLFTTHWATAFYVGKLAGTDVKRPYTVMFCPDAYSNGMFNVDCNDFLIPTEEGLKKADRRRMYAGGNGRVVPYPIREEAFALKGRKAELRREAGIGENEFVALLADGGYGMAKLEKTVEELLALAPDMRIIAVCGKNEEAAERLRAKSVPSPTRLDVYGYTDDMLRFVCMSDVFVGKSGANSMAEPTFFGLPVIITKCITPIESGIKKYYTRTVGNAMYIPDPKKAAAALAAFAADSSALEPYRKNAEERAGEYGAEKIADFIYERALAIVEPPMGETYKFVNYYG